MSICIRKGGSDDDVLKRHLEQGGGGLLRWAQGPLSTQVKMAIQSWKWAKLMIYQPMPTMFYLYVDDVDGWYNRAVQQEQRQRPNLPTSLMVIAQQL